MASSEILEHPPVDTTLDRVAEILHTLYDVSGEISPLPGDRDSNFLVESSQGQLMFKIANPAEAAAGLQMQQEVLLHINRWDPDIGVPEPIPTVTKDLVGEVELDGMTVAVCLTSFLSGTTVEDIGWNPQLRRHATAILARLGLTLRAFTHERLEETLLWDFSRLQELVPRTGHLLPDRRRLVDEWLAHFEADVAPGLPALRRQAIHGDFNPANLIVLPDRPDRLAGIIDFGDMAHGPLVADPAIAAAYQCLGAADPGAVIIDAATEFHHTVPLTRDEAELLAPLAITRLVQSIIISSWRASLHPDNSEYIMIHAEPVWRALETLSLDRVAELTAPVVAACGYDEGGGHLDTAAALRRRHRSLGPGLRLTYDRPLHAATADGVWITDTAGVPHLDAYNNVAHVGHSRAEVVAAISRQAALLNTNTRYLVDNVSAYAERVAALLPDSLEVVYFANSGSEANDLAWRIARTVTGHRGMITTRHAYHGSTYLTMATSPEELGLENLEPWVTTVPPPGRDTVGVSSIDSALDRLGAVQEQPAAYVCDTVFSSDGIFEPPPGYLNGVYERVRSAGGLCIADEVQAGFGRVGARLWGFVGHGVVPDIVTLGKPMGNGHPLAAVVTSAAIAAQFVDRGYYFSTFAGNPVSAAAGTAVLDVMERDHLPEQADRVGAYLRNGLRNIASDHADIVDVRGPGLFIGLELTEAARASQVQNEMRERRILIGRTGPRGNVLKIRPPLVFEERHADLLLTTLAEVLQS